MAKSKSKAKVKPKVKQKKKGKKPANAGPNNLSRTYTNPKTGKKYTAT